MSLFFSFSSVARQAVWSNVGRQAHHERRRRRSEASFPHKAPNQRRGRLQRADLLRNLRLCAIFAQPSEIPVISEKTRLGPATRCHVSAANDARAPITAHVLPTNLTWLRTGRHRVSELHEIWCSRPLKMQLHAKNTHAYHCTHAHS